MEDQPPPMQGWNALLDASHGLQRPAVIPFAPPGGLSPDIVWDTAARYLADPLGQASGQMRLYRDGDPAPVHAATLAAMRADQREVVVFVNRAQCWLGRAFDDLRPWCGGLDAAFPAARYAKELSLIAGKYAGTPFGAHIDSPLERTVHFNLGPATKTFLLWPAEVYVQITGGWAPCFDLEKLMPAATRIEAPPGSAFVLPETHFHIAASPDFTCTLVLTLRRRRSVDTCAEIAEWMAAAIIDSSAEDPEGFDAPDAPLMTRHRFLSEPVSALAARCYAKWKSETCKRSGFDFIG